VLPRHPPCTGLRNGFVLGHAAPSRRLPPHTFCRRLARWLASREPKSPQPRDRCAYPVLPATRCIKAPSQAAEKPIGRNKRGALRSAGAKDARRGSNTVWPPVSVLRLWPWVPACPPRTRGGMSGAQVRVEPQRQTPGSDAPQCCCNACRLGGRRFGFWVWLLSLDLQPSERAEQDCGDKQEYRANHQDVDLQGHVHERASLVVDDGATLPERRRSPRRSHIAVRQGVAAAPGLALNHCVCITFRAGAALMPVNNRPTISRYNGRKNHCRRVVNGIARMVPT
jgi:hypothetical protein